MDSTTLVVVCVVAFAVLVVVLLVRSKSKAAPEEPRFEPPRELAKRPSKETPQATPKADAAPQPSSEPATPSTAPTSSPKVETAAKADTTTAPPPIEEADAATRVDAGPPSTEEVEAEQIVEAASAKKTPATPTTPPPLPGMKKALPSYSNITDAAIAEESTSDKAEAKGPRPPISEPKVPAATAEARTSEPKVPAKLPTSEPKVPAAKLPTSEPKVPAAKLPTSEPKVPAAKLTSEPKVPAAKLPTSEPKIAAAKPAADEHDFSALNDPTPAKQAEKAAAVAATSVAARFMPPSNPATADLEKNDPRHAAARRLARVSVSEIKLYHEAEVTAGREAKDLWKRLQQDIALARQTFESRVAAEVRERFDYLLDEIIRQLAEGDAQKLGPEAPSLKASDGAAGETTATTPTAVEEAPTKTELRTVEPEPMVAAPVAAPQPTTDGKPTGIAARALPTNPETAELEKNDPRHAAARRLARLSVSEIKLYHEDEVKAGREAKDLWKRLAADINLATQTFDKRVDKEVRDRFDYLHDEILRQLAEGDAAKLGTDAPKAKAPGMALPTAPVDTPTKPPEADDSNPVAEVSAPVPPPPVVVAPAPVPTPPAAPAPTVQQTPPLSTAAAAAAARYAPPQNPATADLEKSDPRHAAARRLARLSVSEIKLYHEDEVKAGREAKDLWKRLMTDIGLATQTFEKRVDKEVRDRFDYLYDEILRQLAEGDVSKLGPDAPKPRD